MSTNDLWLTPVISTIAPGTLYHPVYGITYMSDNCRNSYVNILIDCPNLLYLCYFVQQFNFGPFIFAQL